MDAFASLLLAITLLLYLIAIPFGAHGYKLILDPVEYMAMESADDAPHRWNKREQQLETDNYEDNRLDIPERVFHAVMPQIDPKSRYIKALKYMDEGPILDTEHRTVRRRL